jgi:hypothetical protein
VVQDGKHVKSGDESSLTYTKTNLTPYGTTKAIAEIMVIRVCREGWGKGKRRGRREKGEGRREKGEGRREKREARSVNNKKIG